MRFRRWSMDRQLERPSGHGLVVVPLALIVVITLVDVHSPTDVHLGPLLVIAPALTASIAGPRLTALVGLLAVGAQILIGALHGGLGTANHISQIIAITLLSVLIVIFCRAGERRRQELNRVRSVSEAAQRVLLRPPPRKVGPLRVAWLYLAAGDEAKIGGDLFAVARAAHPSTRALIGDVRGKGLASIGEASVVLGAFREGAHRHALLPDLVAAMDDSVARNLEEVADTEHDAGEHFVTALVLDIPDDGPHAEMVTCGHPPPLLVREHQVTELAPRQSAPPLGMGELPGPPLRSDRFAFTAGDFLVLYTDGVIEARSPTGAFYPLAERVASFPSLPAGGPDSLLNHIHRDLLAHTGGQLNDDIALLVIERVPTRHLLRPLLNGRPMADHAADAYPDGAPPSRAHGRGI
ncbi:MULTISPECIES: PP2C family protein-serine/threonine phosphatase [unclassified Streptomyces]|uniref:PP2C family protein-serine/threonine phosphatase n=1 Tax=unclassified Streptomyces TaxID=2593676 RepID=UPI002DDAC7E4|nr:PP2C family protein-serine/threonine phosphatase [Streptomyces sp. NBC_01445]WSE09488.1 serine/threonine-protein phosphatase [Streptomyces sp. NBC_01445]